MAKICLLKYTSNRQSANTKGFLAPLFMAIVMGFGLCSLNMAAAETLDAADECENYVSEHPIWIFCDDFEDGTPLVREGRYFEYGSDDGDFILKDGVGLNASAGMRTLWQPGEVGAGGLKLAFGRNPSGYMNKGIRDNEDFREVYYRMYLKMQAGWQGNPAKLSRATVISANDWSQAMIAHLWGNSELELLIDPVRCVDANDNVKCIGYNDFSHMDWLGYRSGITPIFDTQSADRWYCIEAHVKLNDPGQSNGLQEFWIDGKHEARRENLNFVRSYTDFAINAIFIENYWNAGSPQSQERYVDNFVVSMEKIGCLCAAFGDCAGDFDGDGDVDALDFAVFSESFGVDDCTRFREGDFDANCRVDGNDLAVFAEDYGRVPL
jgi:hypothetical protein